MDTAWAIKAVGLLLTTVGALLVFLHIHRTPPMHTLDTPEGRTAFMRHQRGVVVAVGLLSLWILLEALALILL